MKVKNIIILITFILCIITVYILHSSIFYSINSISLFLKQVETKTEDEYDIVIEATDPPFFPDWPNDYEVQEINILKEIEKKKQKSSYSRRFHLMPKRMTDTNFNPWISQSELDCSPSSYDIINQSWSCL